MTSIEGNRGEPRPRPPVPAVKGLFGKPTIINNVETYANIPQIILNGVEWFTAMGTEKSKGTKVFALGGKITNTGLVEVPMGTTLREVVEEVFDPAIEISLDEARKINKKVKMEDIVEVEITPANFGRISVKISKEVSAFVFIFLCVYIATSYSGKASKKSIWSLISGNTSIRVFTIAAIFLKSISFVTTSLIYGSAIS